MNYGLINRRARKRGQGSLSSQARLVNDDPMPHPPLRKVASLKAALISSGAGTKAFALIHVECGASRTTIIRFAGTTAPRKRLIAHRAQQQHCRHRNSHGVSESSGHLLPPSPPHEKATTSQDQTRQTCTDDRSRHAINPRPCTRFGGPGPSRHPAAVENRGKTDSPADRDQTL